MANTRLYRENITFLLAHPEAFADRTAPTAAELNNTTLVHNITCALNEAGTEFTLGDSDTDDTLTFCSKAGIKTPTFYNPTVKFEAFRDASVSATGEFNEAFNLLAFPDIEYIAILRVGGKSSDAFAAGDVVKMVAVKTDIGTDVVASGENIRIAQAFLNNDFVNWNYEVAA
jgi:hypothetical protein